VIEVKAKLFTVDTSKDPSTRTYIDLEVDELFQLSGRSAEKKHRDDYLKQNSRFRFRVKAGDAKMTDIETGNVKIGDVKIGIVKLGDVQAGDAKIGGVKTGGVKTGETIDLSGKKYLVFQVSARHSFTNFTSLAIQRWTFTNNKLVPWDGKKDRFT